VAHTANVYDVPLVKPDTVIGDDAADAMIPSGVEMAE
jgi:hypothetical protein